MVSRLGKIALVALNKYQVQQYIVRFVHSYENHRGRCLVRSKSLQGANPSFIDHKLTNVLNFQRKKNMRDTDVVFFIKLKLKTE